MSNGTEQLPLKQDTEFPRFLFHEGTNTQTWRYLGAHKLDETGEYVFRVFAPHAKRAFVVGEFNNWSTETGAVAMNRYDGGVWEGFGHGLHEGMMYRYVLETKDGTLLFKSDPYGFYMEKRPGTASILYDISGYPWQDQEWMQERDRASIYRKPVNIYEIHFGSWKMHEDGRRYTYREMADELIPYVLQMGYTHIEVMPLMEYPFDGSWGYQVIGYYAPTSRYGEPKDLMYFIDRCHQNGIGVLMDWVPAHFPRDGAGLALFDGEPLYEHADPLRGEHPQWGTKIFDYGRTEVQSFLISSAMYWLGVFHFDGLRVDAVSSMLYLDYGRRDGEWRRNRYGGNENLDAVDLLRKLNTAVFREYPGVMMIAEEATAWPLITRPVEAGGLGFNFKWNMGWMNDILEYIALDPIYRQYHHKDVTFSLTYAFSENYILPLSHDEVVHGKKSLVNKWAGRYEQQFANLRVLLGYMMAHPGKKLLFMGGEFAQFIEWNYEKGLDWLLLDYEMHRKMQRYTADLNHFYKENPPLYRVDDSWKGFQWINCDDSSLNIISLRRIDEEGNEIVAILNFSPVRRSSYRLGVYQHAMYHEVFNSDDKKYGGEGIRNPKTIRSEEIPCDGLDFSLELTVPQMACVFLKPGRRLARKNGIHNGGK